jgi:hypothetical protein
MKRSCLSARYRMGNGAVFGTVIGSFAADIQRMRSAQWTPAGAAGDLLPAPGSVPSESPWKAIVELPALEPLFRERSIAAVEAGRIGPEWMEQFLAVLRTHEAVAVGSRIVILAELDRVSGTVKQWAEAIATLLPILPKRVGLVISGAPSALTPSGIVVDGDPHLEIVDADDLPKAEESGDDAYHYRDSPLAGDQPAEHDLLRVDGFADGLARLVVHPNTKPLTIGIHGPWGSGKSSFMGLIEQNLMRRAAPNVENGLTFRLKELDDLDADLASRVGAGSLTPSQLARVEERLRPRRRDRNAILEKMRRGARDDVIVVNFNAWQYDTANQVWAGLASEITRTLEATRFPVSALAYRLLFAARKRTAAFFLPILIPLAVAALAGLWLWRAGPDTLTLVAKDVFGFAGTLSGGLFVLGLVVWRVALVAMPISQRVLQYARGPDYGQQMGLQRQVIEDLKEVTDALRRWRWFKWKAYDVPLLGLRMLPVGVRARRVGPPRVVVFIDDLDRCSDEKVVEILQAINLILAKSRFYVFIGMDTEMVYRAIQERYHQTDSITGQKFAEDYLRKIIQLSFHLPTTEPNVRFDLLSQGFSPLARLELRFADAQKPGRPSGRAAAGSPADAGRAATDGDAAVGNGGERRSGSRPKSHFDDPFWFDPSILQQPRVVIRKDVEDTKEELDAFRDLVEFISVNPRAIKRLVNVHRLVRILLVRPETPLNKATQRKLVGWLVFCARWEELVNDLIALGRQKNVRVRNCLAALAEEQPPHRADLLALAKALGPEAIIAPADLARGQLLPSAAYISQMVRDDAPAVSSTENGSTAPAQPVSPPA